MSNLRQIKNFGDYLTRMKWISRNRVAKIISFSWYVQIFLNANNFIDKDMALKVWHKFNINILSIVRATTEKHFFYDCCSLSSGLIFETASTMGVEINDSINCSSDLIVLLLSSPLTLRKHIHIFFYERCGRRKMETNKNYKTKEYFCFSVHVVAMDFCRVRPFHI